MMQGGSKTFFAASRLLPPRVRTAAIALYAFCRVADDLVDEAAAGDTPLDVLQERLDAIYAGTPHDHVDAHALSLSAAPYTHLTSPPNGRDYLHSEFPHTLKNVGLYTH